MNKEMKQPIPVAYPSIPTMYDTKMKENFHIFGVASIIYAVLYVFFMYKNDAGIAYPLFVIASLVFLHFCFKKLEMKWKKESIFYMASMMLLSISTCCTDDAGIIFFNKIGVFLLTISLLLGTFYDTKKWNLGKYVCAIVKVCIMAVGEVPRPFVDAIWYCKNKLDKKNCKYLYVLLGVGIAIPVFVVVFLLLMSADVVFRNMADNLLSVLNFGDICVIVFLLAFMFLATYSILTYLCRRTIKEEVVDSRKWEPMIAIPVASILSVLYVVFSGIQIVYLFIGNMQLPAEYTYAEYAREGFFQLLAVSIINLIIVLMGLYFFKPSKGLKIVLTIMSLCTFVMIASSALRMIIYIQYYYLTSLRILVLWSLVVLTLIFVGVVVYIIRERFPLFRYSMIVVTSLYICLSFSHPDYWIAKINLASTQESRNDFFKGEPYSDYVYLSSLSADAAPVMVEWIAELGYNFKAYHEEKTTFGYYSEMNGSTQYIDPQEWCVYRYQRQLSRRCTNIKIRNFNISRFYADFSIALMGENQ